VGYKGDQIKQRIINAADQLFYQNGYEKTSFSDIANTISISRGNFYYHFKSKNEILNAVIQSRFDAVNTLLEQWNCEHEDAKTRISCYIELLVHKQKDIKKYGCPVGSLCMELAKISHAMRDDATAVQTLFRHWLEIQFQTITNEKDASQHAMHLIGCCQGIASTANTFNDTTYLTHEVSELKNWITSLNT